MTPLAVSLSSKLNRLSPTPSGHFGCTLIPPLLLLLLPSPPFHRRDQYLCSGAVEPLRGQTNLQLYPPAPRTRRHINFLLEIWLSEKKLTLTQLRPAMQHDLQRTLPPFPRFLYFR